MRRLVFALFLVLLPLVGVVGGSPASAVPSCEPYCNGATSRVVNRLEGSGHGPWLATVLDQYGYEARRWAEITRIPGGHGKRHIGVIHVPEGHARGARRALDRFWFAKKGRTFVLPLVTATRTQGGRGAPYGVASRWAARRLGDGWQVNRP